MELIKLNKSLPETPTEALNDMLRYADDYTGCIVVLFGGEGILFRHTNNVSRGEAMAQMFSAMVGLSVEDD